MFHNWCNWFRVMLTILPQFQYLRERVFLWASRDSSSLTHCCYSHISHTQCRGEKWRENDISRSYWVSKVGPSRTHPHLQIYYSREPPNDPCGAEWAVWTFPILQSHLIWQKKTVARGIFEIWRVRIKREKPHPASLSREGRRTHSEKKSGIVPVAAKTGVQM